MSKVKKFVAVITAVCCLGIGNVYAKDINVVVDGKTLAGDTILKNGTTYVPIRAVAESMGAYVTYDEATNTAIIKSSQESAVEMVADVSKSVVAIVGNYKDEDINDRVEAVSHGSGVIIKSGGEILTNAHVVKNLEQIIVVMSDGLGYTARLKYIDEDFDLAVVKIDKIGLTPIKFADPSEIVAGKTAYAIGTPVSFSLRNSVSKGIISGINCAAFSDYRLIQTDAAINPGNSGGPLVNAEGKLLGINSSKFVASYIEGIGFAIPVDTVKYVLNQFDTYGRVRKVDLGMKYQNTWAASMGFPTQEGLNIKFVEKGSSADAAGIRAGDIINKIGSNEIHSIVDFNEAMKNYKIGNTAVFEIQRGGQIFKTNVIITE